MHFHFLLDTFNWYRLKNEHQSVRKWSDEDEPDTTQGDRHSSFLPTMRKAT